MNTIISGLQDEAASFKISLPLYIYASQAAAFDAMGNVK